MWLLRCRLRCSFVCCSCSAYSDSWPCCQKPTAQYRSLSKADESERGELNSLTSSFLSLPQPASYDSYAAALRAAVAEPLSTTSAKPTTSDLPSLAQLIVARPTPLKYTRKGGSTASGKPTKKATISSVDDTQLLASLDISTPAFLPTQTMVTAPAAASTTASSGFTAAVSLAAFVHSSVPLLVEYWLESLGGDEAAAQQSLLTTDSYQCAEACVSILHTYSTLPSSFGASLQPFFALLSAHVFYRFPLVGMSSTVTAADVDVISSINVHICHLIAAFVPPAVAPSNDSSDGSEVKNSGKGSENRKRHESEEAGEVDEWTTEMLEFIGQSLFQSSSTTQAAVAMNGAGKRRKKKKRGEASAALLSPSHVGELLPIIGVLVERLPSPQQRWLLEAFTTYYTSLHALSPAKLQCVSLISTLLQPPTGGLCLSTGVGHAWLRSLPSLLVSSARCRPTIIRLLQYVMRYWHNHQGLDLSELVEQCTAFYCEHLLSVSVELQMVALSLLPYASMLPAPLLSAFVAMFNASGVGSGVRCMMMEMVATQRHRIGVSAYLSYLLSCLSSRRDEEAQQVIEKDGCHPHVELVLVRLRELAGDAVLLQLLPATSPSRSPAELLVLLLSPTLRSLSSATEGEQVEGSLLDLTPLTLTAVIRCLCQQVRQSTQSPPDTQLLPPSLATPLTTLLATILHPSFSTAAANTTPNAPTTTVTAVSVLLASAPFLVPLLLSQLLLPLAEDDVVSDAGWLCDVLLSWLHGSGGLRKWLQRGEAARLMREAVMRLQQVAGVDLGKVQAIEMLL